MNSERIIAMLVRRLANRGISAGINHLSRQGKAPEDMSPAERRKAREIRQNAKRARQAARMMRRMR
ncbi:MAG TPA: hypothetical protein ENK83_04245 [Aliiroseovarius sp.]|nr:hypothetical protein [Aliiroseovarius sp.]